MFMRKKKKEKLMKNSPKGDLTLFHCCLCVCTVHRGIIQKTLVINIAIIYGLDKHLILLHCIFLIEVHQTNHMRIYDKSTWESLTHN